MDNDKDLVALLETQDRINGFVAHLLFCIRNQRAADPDITTHPNSKGLIKEFADLYKILVPFHRVPNGRGDDGKPAFIMKPTPISLPILNRMVGQNKDTISAEIKIGISRVATLHQNMHNYGVWFHNQSPVFRQRDWIALRSKEALMNGSEEGEFI